MTILFERCEGTAAGYLALAHLDLGRDAATLFDPHLPARPWVRELQAAYLAAPDPLLLQGLPLRHGDDLRAAVGSAAAALGPRLATAFVAALDDLRSHAPAWAPIPEPLVEPWTRLRAALWERVGPPPRWRIFDVPALGHRGRALGIGSVPDREQRIAVCLAAPAEHVLCQVFHEAVHAVTDPVVLRGVPIAQRSTRVDAPGFALHAALEDAAIEVGEAIIRARAPELEPAYATWRATFG